LNITLVSVLVALVVGTIELLSIVSDKLALKGGLWDLVENINFETLGVIIVAIFVVSWLLSTIVYKIKKYDDIEVESLSNG